MESNIILKHKAVYGNKVRVFLILSIVTLLLTMLFAFLAFGLSEIGAVYFVVSMISLTLFITFIILAVILNSRKKRYGNYEEIDVVENRILYKNEKDGITIYEPENIKEIVIDKYTLKNVPDEQYFIKIIPSDSKTILKVPSAVSKYGELVRKLREFKKNNF